MDNKPELIAFSQYKLGGVQSFYYNILSHIPENSFDIRWIFCNDYNDTDAPLLEKYNCCEEIVFEMNQKQNESVYGIAKRLSSFISDKPGVVVTNFYIELVTMHLYRKPGKTVFFVCHDEGYLKRAFEFCFIIDVFIAHNEQYFDELRQMMPTRAEDIYYLPYGVKITGKKRNKNLNGPLRIVFVARLQRLKGIFDISVIDEMLQHRNVKVKWTIIGAGPEKESLEKLLLPKGNFTFLTPPDGEAVLDAVKENDVFILPSRLDGLPVAMLEAMSVGCVPVISEFNKGIKKVVTPDIGFVLPVGDIDKFADTLQLLHEDRPLLENLGKNAKKKIVEEYDIQKRAFDYTALFLKYKELKLPVRRRIPSYGGFLEHPFIPKVIVKVVRKIKSLLIK